MNKSVKFVLLAVLLGSTLGGCGVEYITKFHSNERSIIETGWAKPQVHYADPIYCYRTLSTPMCYDEPRQGEENRIVGYFGPRPY